MGVSVAVEAFFQNADIRILGKGHIFARSPLDDGCALPPRCKAAGGSIFSWKQRIEVCASSILITAPCAIKGNIGC
jgi:hypothetical protein